MPVDERIVEAIERLMVESVSITTIALGQASPDFELSFPQWRALVVVGSRDGMRVGDIAERIGSAVPTTSRLIRRLERRGLVVGERDDADRRATIVRLTADGERLHVALVECRRDLVRVALERSPEPISKGLQTGLEQIGEALRTFE
jgi:DNA-binding MarR family transcriptional regulator